GVVTSE
nr:Chain A, Porin 1 [Providencia stuartii]5N9I_B Chain B, Porin 1 [Providencia stuartii]5N9I_C Chain C, Porin 1 [Providencia stuartii]5N9I_D Chain D, Porin 1 [Providencia stuartii]